MHNSPGQFDDTNLHSLNQALAGKGYQLEYDGDVLQLTSIEQAFKPLSIDFVAGRNRHRRLFGGGAGQSLARAVGIKGTYRPVVLDVTAGLAKDTFVLATLGCEVIMLERSPVIAALLANALERATADIDIVAIIQRLSLLQADSLHYLQQMSAENLPSVIYMDPMYPHRDKSALVKKEMRIFRDLVGDDRDSSQLLQLARQKVLKRVVVKRPKGAGFLGECKPHSQISSKNTRYDIYLPV